MTRVPHLWQEHTGPTVGRLKHLGRPGRGWEQICLVCSAASEAFGAARTLSALIQRVKSESGRIRQLDVWAVCGGLKKSVVD